MGMPCTPLAPPPCQQLATGLRLAPGQAHATPGVHHRHSSPPGHPRQPPRAARMAQPASRPLPSPRAPPLAGAAIVLLLALLVAPCACGRTFAPAVGPPPRFQSCPGSQALFAAMGQDTAQAWWQPPLAPGGTASVEGDHSPGDSFFVGATIVNYVAYGHDGALLAHCQFLIQVRVNEPLVCPLYLYPPRQLPLEYCSNLEGGGGSLVCWPGSCRHCSGSGQVSAMWSVHVQHAPSTGQQQSTMWATAVDYIRWHGARARGYMRAACPAMPCKGPLAPT